MKKLVSILMVIALAACLFTAAVADSNTGFAVPAEGQAHLMMFECGRCEGDAEERSARWEKHHSEAMGQWQGVRDRLSVMDNGAEVIEAAELEMDDIRLRLWNEAEWKAMDEQLAAVRAVIDGEKPCAVEEFAAQRITMNDLEEKVEKAIAHARTHAARYLYLCRLLDEIGVQLLEKYRDWSVVEENTHPVVNSGEMTLESGYDEEQRIEVTVTTSKRNPDVLNVHMLESTFDFQNTRWARLMDAMKALAQKLNGINGPRMSLSGINLYTEGDKVGVVFDVILSAGGGLFTPGETAAEEQEERPGTGHGTDDKKNGEVSAL